MKPATILSVLALAVLSGCRTDSPPPTAARAASVLSPSSTPEPKYEGQTIDILVSGHLLEGRQGIYRFRPDESCTLLNLIFRMKGLPAHVDTRAVKFIRKNEKGEEEIEVDVRKVLNSGESKDGVPLKHGDRVVFPARLYAM